MRPLTPKQIVFCNEYLVDLNATGAARRAGYSPKYCREQGFDNLRKPNIMKYIQERMDKRAKKVGITADNVLKSLKTIAECDITEFIEAWDNNDLQYKQLKDIPKHLRVCIKSFKTNRDGIEVKFHDPMKAYEMIARHIGFFNNDQSQTPEIQQRIKIVKTYVKHD